MINPFNQRTHPNTFEAYQYAVDVLEGEMPEYPNYKIYSNGKIYSKYYKKFICSKGDKNGYLRVCLKNEKGLKTFKIHRVILTTFNPVKDMHKLVVNHINGIKTDNNLKNLEWLTNRENIDHAIKTGLKKNPKEGTKSNKAIFSINDLKFIYKRKLENATSRQIAKELKTKDSNINQILAGKRYKKDFKNFRDDLIRKNIIPNYQYIKGIRVR